jgi:mesencephalic astrocyte-derived neurotrophic factor
LLVFVSFSSARIREGECEVCLKDVTQFQKELSKLGSQDKIEAGIRKICKGYTNKADKRFCYYIGGSDDAATSLLRTISGPLMNHMPVEKICERLKQADGQICAVKYEKPKEPVDYSKVDFNKMRVKELRDILNEWGVKAEKISEKTELIELIKKELPKHLDQNQGAKKEL